MISVTADFREHHKSKKNRAKKITGPQKNTTTERKTPMKIILKKRLLKTHIKRESYRVKTNVGQREPRTPT